MSTKKWSDQRSGVLGCMAGNVVLGKLGREFGERIEHVKGTTFSTKTKIIVGRICTTTKYLQKDVVHFCNLSNAQTDTVIGHDDKSALFLFITLEDTKAHYWLVPGELVKKVVASLKPKPSSPSCHLRIHDRGDSYWLDDTNITKYHHTMPIKNRSKQINKAVASVVRKKKRSGAIPVNFKVNGVQYSGTVAAQSCG